ncbi:MAG: exodeoxyribonuclease VII large subunit [Nocardioidaceae bacterium]
MALETSYEKPAPVRVIAQAVSGYVDRLGPVWVEGQVAQLTRRPSTATVFVVLRDPVAEVSVKVTCSRSVFDSLTVPVTEGARVVIHARLRYYVPRGTLSLVADEIRPVGVGELLARIEQRRQLLAAEGLFDAARKRPLPFLPREVGLVVGRSSAAERDVLDNARKRWPGVVFRVEYAVVQGHDAARQVIEAIGVLDKDPDVEVIIVARGGGALEDLLPFSDEGLLRAVARCRTPVVSAIGHEPDQPLLDLVADVRASTPTDAAKRVVPDVAEEVARIDAMRTRSTSLLRAIIDQQQRGLDGTRSRPVLTDPHRMFDDQARTVHDLRGRSRRHLDQRLERAAAELGHHLAQVRGLSPLATLRRGYSVLQDGSGRVVTDPAQVGAGDDLLARLAAGSLRVTVASVASHPPTDRTEVTR